LRPTASSKHGIEVLSTQPIMPKKYLSLIKVRDKVLVVGMSENSISLLKEIDYDDSFTNKEKQKNESFSELLKKNLGMK
jgi:flagellar protein FliO/FliZ